ncbi:flagellar hook-length control protein FliK [uncultured Roseobacter sp.]|uniref:flagellar hook-length control protein FliK n=1 Tax=uncultured Roseobacter sp. TaxID=114847 RepID=UPI00261D8109|nr:flagellar hook-length control protein FliK [uncultured Roseobacter sp.]
MLDIPFLKSSPGPARTDSVKTERSDPNRPGKGSDEFEAVMAEEAETAGAENGKPEDVAEAPNAPSEKNEGESDPEARNGSENDDPADSVDQPEATFAEDIDILEAEAEDSSGSEEQISEKAPGNGQAISELAFLQRATVSDAVRQEDGRSASQTVKSGALASELNKQPRQDTLGVASAAQVIGKKAEPPVVAGMDQASQKSMGPDVNSRENVPVNRMTAGAELPETAQKAAALNIQQLRDPRAPDREAKSEGPRRTDLSDSELRAASETVRKADNIATKTSPNIVIKPVPTPAENALSVNAAAKGEVFDLQPVVTGSSETAQWDPRSNGPANLNQILARAETPAMVARQMAEILQKMPDKPVELLLSPRELGRVRMSISAGEGTITVNVVAERPETLDLMKRNIDQLAREFESIGYDTINFSFSEGQQQSGEGETASDQSDSQIYVNHDAAEQALPEVNGPIPARLAEQTGVDIRL